MMWRGEYWKVRNVIELEMRLQLEQHRNRRTQQHSHSISHSISMRRRARRRDKEQEKRDKEKENISFLLFQNPLHFSSLFFYCFSLGFFNEKKIHRKVIIFIFYLYIFIISCSISLISSQYLFTLSYLQNE